MPNPGRQYGQRTYRAFNALWKINMPTFLTLLACARALAASCILIMAPLVLRTSPASFPCRRLFMRSQAEPQLIHLPRRSIFEPRILLAWFLVAAFAPDSTSSSDSPQLSAPPCFLTCSSDRVAHLACYARTISLLWRPDGYSSMAPPPVPIVPLPVLANATPSHPATHCFPHPPIHPLLLPTPLPLLRRLGALWSFKGVTG